MSKLIVTHHHPDLDAIGAVWLLKRFGGEEWKEASLAFVPAGKTYKGLPADSDEKIVHVDTGGGRFDHHDEKRNKWSASWLVWKWLKREDDRALQKLVEVINDVDHFGEYFWPEPLHERYAFMLHSIIPGLHSLNVYSNEAVVEMGMKMLDGVYAYLKDVEHAYDVIKEKGWQFETRWGRGLAVETGSDNVMKVAQKMGYKVVIRRDPKQGFTKIKAAPLPEIDLSMVYAKIRELEKDEKKWFFHPSKHMLINGSSKNTEVEPTSLNLKQLVHIVERG